MPIHRPCLTCGTLTTSTYCRKCEPRNGSTRAWRRTRQHILHRDQYACQECGQFATHVDHITPLSAGGTDHPWNLQALCARCNLRKGAR